MSITSANATIFMTIPLLYPVPQQIQQFSADNVFSTDPLKSAETMRGVDGVLTGGYVYGDINQNFELMADSPSIQFFNRWNFQQQADREAYTANAVILLTSLGQKWTGTKGYLKGFPIIPDAKKVLQPVRFSIEWESLTPAAS